MSVDPTPGNTSRVDTSVWMNISEYLSRHLFSECGVCPFTLEFPFFDPSGVWDGGKGGYTPSPRRA